MGRSAKLAKLRKDRYYQLAKEHGYRSRAAFKLIQLNRKFGFLNDVNVVLDLCAAPGGWLQVTANILPLSSTIIGVDLFPIKPIKNTVTIVGDITTPECYQAIRSHLNGHPVDCVLHDGAPNVGQAWESDAFGQAQLTLHSVRMASKLLKTKGWFVTKIFRSRDYPKLISVLKKAFSHVHATKPLASRKESAEIFVVCQGFVGLKNLESSLFDFRSVFKEQDDVGKALTLKSMFKEISKNKPNRSGYKTDSQLLHSSITLSQFLQLEGDLLNVLSTTNQIVFDDDEYGCSKVVPARIKEFASDLKLLGYTDFKRLLEWRREMRARFGINSDNNTEKAVASEKPQLTDEQKIELEIEDAQSELKQLEKRQKRKDAQNARRLKTNMKKAQSVQETNTDINNTGLFSEIVKNGNFMIKDISSDNEESVEEKSREISSDNDSETSEVSDEEERELTAMERQIELQMQFIKNIGINKKKLKHSALSEKLSKNGVNENLPQLLGSEQSSGEEESGDEKLDMDFLEHATAIKEPLRPKKVVEEVEESEESEQDVESNDIDSEKEQSEFTKLTPEMMALAARMKRSKKQRELVIDHMWNRNCWGEENLPEWFAEEEAKATRRILPVTKEEVERYKQAQRSLEMMPRKKVLEARQRRKSKVERLIEKARLKSEKLLTADGNVEDDTAAHHEKVDSIKRIYKRAAKELNRKTEKTYVVARRHLTGAKYARPKSVSGRYKVVDPRQKKDKAHQKAVPVGKQIKRRSKSKRRMKNRRR